MQRVVEHHWYGDRSPSTEQPGEISYGFKEPRSQRALFKTVILDGENPPQLRSRRSNQD